MACLDDAEVAGVCIDACEKEQSALLREYVLSQDGNAPAAEWSSRGDRSLAPFSPCAATRIPHIFAAARLTSQDVLYDLGCGDGRILHEAASRYGCRCVGVEVDEACLKDCRAGGELLEETSQALFRWQLADMSELSDDFFATGALPGGAESLPPATVVLIFITGHGLVKLADWLHRAWKAAPQGVRILTCVEALDTARDYNDGVFAETNLQGWEVYRDPLHAKYGVFVVPPYGCSISAWQASAPFLVPISRIFADESEPLLVHGLLTTDDIERICAFMSSIQPPENEGYEDDDSAIASVLFGDGMEWSAAEDAVHSLREHRVTHLHREGVDARPLELVRAKLLRALFTADAKRWNVLRGRSVYLRSFEHHSYETGGSVMDEGHRDGGSLLTLTVLLGRSETCQGGVFRTIRDADQWQEHEIAVGDAAIFVSEKRHTVTPVTAGTRQSMVMELWGGGVTRHNRHR